MLKRTLVGVGIALVVAGAVAARFWELLGSTIFDLFVFGITFAACVEIVKAYEKKERKMFSFIVLIFPAIVWICYLLAPDVLNAFLYQICALVVLFCVCVVIEIFYPKTKIGKKELEDNPSLYDHNHLLERTFRTIGFLVYPSMILGTLYGIDAFGIETGFVALLCVFGVSALSDTFAFFFGCWLKGTRLCPEISPKKGVPGMIFGFVGGLVAAGIIFGVFYFTKLLPSSINDMKLGSAIAMFTLIGILGSLVTQVGDLFESALKRRLEIKDFGNCFPGHGGVMDRIDGQMFCSVLVLICFMLFV